MIKHAELTAANGVTMQLRSSGIYAYAGAPALSLAVDGGGGIHLSPHDVRKLITILTLWLDDLPAQKG